jgi:tetratricopeptide (TPR) repeat protein
MRSAELLARRQAIVELRKIRAILEPNKRKRWYEKLYSKILTFAKYVGIPALIIAAIGPIQKLVSDLVEYQNKALIQNVYLDYASTLLAAGSIDRADKLLTTLESQKDFDARLQYYKSKVLIAMAIQQGRNYAEALDTASILSEITEKKPLYFRFIPDFFPKNFGPYFPSFGTAEDFMELNFALIDINIAQKDYAEARTKIDSMRGKREFVRNPTFTPNVQYRTGRLDVLQNKTSEGQQHLLTARDLGKTAGQTLLTANATFQLAKTYQQPGDRPTALLYYKEAEKGYASLPDNFGLLKTYNDIATVYFDDRNYDESANYSNKAQLVALEVGDDLGYARAIANIAAIEKMEHNYSRSITLSLAALGVFKQQGNLRGIMTSANILANAYEAIGDYADALAYGKQDFDASLDLEEPRQVSAACGILSNIYADTGDRSETAFASLCATALIKQLRMDTFSESVKDYDFLRTRLRELITGDDDSAALIENVEKRVRDIFLKLNLGTDVIDNEIASLQASSSSARSERARVPGLAQIEFEVKKRILCEIEAAVKYVNRFPISEGLAPDKLKQVAKYPIPLDWIAAVSLSFELDEFSGVNLDDALNTPLPSAVKALGHGTSSSVGTPQSRILGFGGPLSSTAARIDKFDPTYPISHFMASQGPNSVCRPENDPLTRAGLKADSGFSPFMIEGTLGIQDWLFGAILAGIFLNGSGGAPTEPVSYEIKFVLVSNGNITPTWKIVTVPANTSGAVSTGRTRTHDLIITIGPSDNRTLFSHLASQIGQATGGGANATRPMPHQ